MTPALRAYIESWLDKAGHDLMSAQRLLEIEPMILDNACFHCQQAIEKGLKAFLAYPIFATVDPLNINAYAVQGRYPDSNLMPTTAEAKAYYQLALQVQALVTERIVFS
jgi:hypothetical protein